ncbi:MAG TPA: sulfatase-like hydrolase/transferase, partial [Oceanipulchritudo sp.]|nr:sulfatase-like hydrolase/transferase [Oceanipulchritudo sp.]
ASSGMLVDRNEESAFLEAMRAGGVDLYIAGEVHSNTVTLDSGSELVQWVSRGNGTTNFSTVDVTDDKLLVHTWKNLNGAGEDILLGTLVIDKSGPGPRRIETTGLLKAIDPKGLNLHYTFDEPVAANSILTGIADPEVSGTACNRAYANTGEFSAEYTAWAKGTGEADGVLGSAVQLTPGKSVLGLSSMGPLSQDRPRTVAMWLRTTSPDRQILFNTTSFWGKGRDFFNLSLNNGRLEVVLMQDKVKAATGIRINDGDWHHVAVVVPFKGATLDDVQLYVDGVRQDEVDTIGGTSPIKTGQANWIGIGVILSRSSFKLEEEMGMAAFTGALDDFALWTRALTAAEIAALKDGARAGRNAADMEREFASLPHHPVGAGNISKRPNIVILLADDLGYGEVGCYGQQVIQTPTIDALAAKGLRFTDFYAGTAVCSPSRAVLMTGVHAGHASIRGNSGFHPDDGSWGRVALERDELTLAEMLKGAGYQTAFVGKWHLGLPEDVSTWAAGRGFDFAVQEQWGKKAEGGEFDERDHWVNGDEQAIFYDYKEHDCLDEFRTDIILEFLDKQREQEKPLFLFMSYRAPHAHEFFLRETENYKEYGWPELERRHASRITMLDQQIQRLLDKLEEMGELENTFILFTSDNGPHQENGHDHNFFNSSGGLRGFKRDMYEGGVRVPGIVYWPGRSIQGVTSHQATFYDVMPTLAELAGIEIPKRTDGISFLPEVLGKDQEKHDHIYWELQLVKHPDETGFLQATRMGDWKAVRYGSRDKTELYNLKNDLFEQNDVPAQNPQIVERMEGILRKESVENVHYPFSGKGFQPEAGH